MLVRIREGLKVEDLGGEFLVYDADRSVVHRVSAVSAPWLAQLLSGVTVEIDDSVVRELLNADVLEAVTNESATTSRRKVLAIATAATAAVGLTSLMLPSAAAAASVSGPTTIAGPTTAAPTTAAPPPPVNTNFSAVQSYDINDNPQNAVQINWNATVGDGGGAISYTYTISGSTISTITGSGSGGTNVVVPGWVVNDAISVQVVAVTPVLGTNPRNRSLTFIA